MTDQVEQAVQQGEPQETEPLDEFCADLSRTDPRVELIAVFRYRERVAGREHDTAAAYLGRFQQTAAAIL